jgi:glutamyl-tRNA synthetase
VGGARTALFNWLYARAKGGSFVLRIEDTDAERSTGESAASIIRDLEALGLSWDEGPGCGGECGPYFQSERLELYRAAAERLLADGKAYRSFQTEEERALVRQARERGESAEAEARYTELDRDEEARRMDAGEPFAVVFRVEPGETVVHDLVRGEVRFRNEDLGDFVIVKSDGRASYNFAVVVDDAAMRIDPVLRGEDHLSNTPRQILLYRALGYAVPQFGHVSMILGPDKTRLSKRHGSVSVQHFLAAGIVPEALVNYLALLGWGAGDDREFFTLEELVGAFSLDRVARTAATFDPAKLEWMNGRYLADLPDEQRGELVHAFLQSRGLREMGQEVSPARARELAALVGDRMKTVPMFLDYAGFFFEESITPSAEDIEGVLVKRAVHTDLCALARRLDAVEPWNDAGVETAFRDFAEESELKLRDIVGPARLAVSGKRQSPGMFESITLLGKERSVSRLCAFGTAHPPRADES